MLSGTVLTEKVKEMGPITTSTVDEGTASPTLFSQRITITVKGVIDEFATASVPKKMDI